MCVHVIVAPLVSSTVVLSSGTTYGFIGLILMGGHLAPTSTFGLNDEWKKLQKNERNRQTSLIMNNNIPSRKPLSTLFVCFPCNVASRLTSRHHKRVVMKINSNPIYFILKSNICILLAMPVTNNSLPIEPVNGHGLGSTR